MALKIKQLAFFGDSYCHDSKHNPASDCSITPHLQQQTYIDMLSDQLQLPVVHFGMAGHGPMWTIHQLLEWTESNKSAVPETYFVFCWSDINRQLVKTWDDDPCENLEHPGETMLIDPDCLTYIEGDVSPQYVKALNLYYLYLYSEPELTRRGRIVYHALQDIYRKYCITETQRQEYYCFDHTLWLNGTSLPFEYNGTTWDSLYFFAQHFDDYGVQGVDDSNYRNHFSDNGHVAFTEVIRARYMQHMNLRGTV